MTKKKIFEIAAKHSYEAKTRGDLEQRWNDSEDFIEVPVWGIEAMIAEAYEAGKKAAKK